MIEVLGAKGHNAGSSRYLKTKQKDLFPRNVDNKNLLEKKSMRVKR